LPLEIHTSPHEDEEEIFPLTFDEARKKPGITCPFGRKVAEQKGMNRQVEQFPQKVAQVPLQSSLGGARGEEKVSGRKALLHLFNLLVLIPPLPL
jgi:hypothetical protein